MRKNCFTIFVLLMMAPALFIGCSSMSRSQSRYNEALAFKKQGNIDMYKQGVREAHRMDANDVFAMNEMANIYWTENKIPEARAQYVECIEKGKSVIINECEIQEFVGKQMSELCKFNLGKLDKYVQAQKHQSDVFAMNKMANIYWTENKIPEARAQYVECIEKGKDVIIGVSEIQEFVGKPVSELCKFNLDKLEKFVQSQEEIKGQAAAQPDIKNQPLPEKQIEKKTVVMDKPKGKEEVSIESVTVAVPAAHLRSEPSLTSSPAGYVTEGMSLLILDKSKDNEGRDWYRIKLPGSQKEAWISSRVVKP